MKRLLIVFMLMCPALASAQIGSTAQITGTVRDESGGVLWTQQTVDVR